ncbi:MAG: protease modulator HflC [Chromatiales bacterium]|jgi:membrane protease subunit HflC|nr:protease modulator HflC [Chromatiales bacterium]MDX9768280.1 protease modulator HflC [Ectothiorhodospiraceae bacterium]
MINVKSLGAIAAFALVVIAMSTYTVDQRERAILFSLGEIKRDDVQPGLHFKFPLVNNVRKFDARVLTLDIPPDRFLTSEKKNVIVDFFVKWRIDDVGQYYRSTRGDERNAQARLSQILKDGMRNEFGKRNLQEAVSGERSVIMEILRVQANEAARNLGISVIDVRISRIDLPDEVSESVYNRMRAERDRVAQDFRARGQEEAERIRARADRERTVILANAYREAERLRGEGDALATEIYAKAYGRNHEFFSFYRSLLAYRNTLSGQGNVFVLEPDSEFFRYFNQSSGKKK